MTRTAKRVLYGYGAFCVVNWGLQYMAARSGNLFGSTQLASLNGSLLGLNILARLYDPNQAAASALQPVQVTATLLPASG